MVNTDIEWAISALNKLSNKLIDLFEEFLGLGYQVHITLSVIAELEGDEYTISV